MARSWFLDRPAARLAVAALALSGLSAAGGALLADHLDQVQLRQQAERLASSSSGTAFVLRSPAGRELRVTPAATGRPRICSPADALRQQAVPLDAAVPGGVGQLAAYPAC